LSKPQLKEECSKQGLDYEGTVQVLRQRLVQQLHAVDMADDQETTNVKASVSSDLSTNPTRTGNVDLVGNSHARGEDDANSVFVELMRQISPLNSEEPEAILRFVARLDDIHLLGLCNDRVFVTRILPLVPGTLLKFFGDCLRNGRNWKECKKQMLREFFPRFIRERLVRDLITFNFHRQSMPVREYIDQVFAAAQFLEYDADEQSLVDRVVMNLHPDILAHAAFVDRPHSRKELYDRIGIVEEKMAVVRERQRNESSQPVAGEREQRKGEVRRNVLDYSRPPKCWCCGRLGHIQRNCQRGNQQSGNGQGPGGSRDPGRQS